MLQTLMIQWTLIPVHPLWFVMLCYNVLQTLMTQWTLIPIHPMWFVDLHGRWILSMVIGLLHCVCWILIYAAALTMDLPEMLGIKQVTVTIKCLY